MNKGYVIANLYEARKFNLCVFSVYYIENGKYYINDCGKKLTKDVVSQIPKKFIFETYEEALRNLRKLKRYSSLTDKLGKIPVDWNHLEIRKIYYGDKI